MPRRIAFGEQLRSLIWRTPVAEEVDAELAFHLEMRVREYLARGMDPAAARAAALGRFGDLAAVNRICREIGKRRDQDMQRAELLSELRQDARYAFRQFLKSPGFFAVAVLTLALGIGANAAIFSVVNAVLLRPLPLGQPDRLAMVWLGTGGDRAPTSWQDFVDWRANSRSFSDLAALDSRTVTLTGDGEAARLNGTRTTSNLFSVLGVRVERGRALTVDDDRPGAPPVAVLSHEFWQSRFGSDPGIVGREIRLDGEATTVVGVAAPGVGFPNRTQVWRAFHPAPRELSPPGRGIRYLMTIGRLAPGGTVAGAGAELSAVAKRLAEQYPQSNGDASAIDVVGLNEQVVGGVRTPLLVLLGAVALVLLIACANVANLLLVRAAGRSAEIAVRTALGAGRGRLIRQLVTESVFLAALGGAAGLMLADVARRLLVRLAPSSVPRLSEVTLDWKVMGFAAAVALMTGVLFGLVPALQASRPDLNRTLKEGGRTAGARGASQRIRSALVVAELALALMLLVGAGLLMRSFYRLQHVDPGFRAANVLTFNIALPERKYRDAQAQRAFADAVLERMRRLPGVRSAALVFGLPLGGIGYGITFTIEGQPPPEPGQGLGSQVRMASPEYFATMGIPLVSGRPFRSSDREGSSHVVVINETAARKFFPDGAPLGKRIRFDNSSDSVFIGGEVVGVVGNVRQFEIKQEPEPEIYMPLAQEPSENLTVVLRAATDPTQLGPSARAEVRALDRDLPVYSMRTMEERVADSVADSRFYMLLLATFAGVALVLAAVGTYGVMSYAVSQRTQEIGIRVALGAGQGEVVRLVVKHGLQLTFVGVALGAAAAYALSRVVQSLLFGVPATDAPTFLAVSALLTSVALAASYVPARRAARVDPLVALRAG